MDNLANIIGMPALPTRVRTCHPEKRLPQTAVCAICAGAGFIRRDVHYGHPAFGKAILCECRLQQKKERQQRALFHMSGILGLQRFQQASFETFHQALPGCREAHSVALQYAVAPAGWLVLLGPCGCGKTHLAVSIARRQIEAGNTVLIQTVPDLLDYLRSSFSSGNGPGYDERIIELREVDLLILDDFGAEHDTPWTIEKLFQLLNHRYNKGIPTVITSNLGLEKVDPRIASRLRDSELVTLVEMVEARDYRIYGNRGEE